MAKVRPFDKIVFGSVATLVIGGFFIFMSASLGLLAGAGEGAQFSTIVRSQFILGLLGGTLALFVMSYIPYKVYRRAGPYLFGFACLLCLLVFIPHVGLALKGAHRWIDLRVTTFQPSEVLKVAYVLLLAGLLSAKKMRVRRLIDGLVPFVVVTGIGAALLLAQPDTGTFLVLAAAGFAMFLVSGATVRDMAILAVIAALGMGALALARPYVLDRFVTFLDPGHDPLGSSYQVQQSMIAIGSGQTLGRGFGQSIQKFTYLPEPIGDSIFAVYAEEFGFVGAVALVLAFLVFTLRGLWVAARSPDMFGGLVAVGIVILVMAQSFLNIGSMLGVFPLTGVPLIFISHGGTALFTALASIGILLNISRARRIG